MMMRCISISLLFVSELLCSAQVPKIIQGADQPRIIDMHLHSFFIPNRENRQTKVNSPATRQEYDRQVTDFLDQFNIVAVTGTSFNGIDSVDLLKAKAGNRILPAMAPKFWRENSGESLEELRNLIRGKKIFAISELVSQYDGIAVNDPILDPLFALAEEEKTPVGIHMGLGPPGAPRMPGAKYRSALSSPLLLEDVLIRHPNLKVWVMHAGWPMLDDMIHLLWSNPEIYCDIGVINWSVPRKEFHDYLERLINAGFGKRIMFGSDQMTWPHTIPLAIEAVDEASFLSKEQKADIFFNNAARFMGWMDEELNP